MCCCPLSRPADSTRTGAGAVANGFRSKCHLRGAQQVPQL